MQPKVVTSDIEQFQVAYNVVKSNMLHSNQLIDQYFLDESVSFANSFHPADGLIYFMNGEEPALAITSQEYNPIFNNIDWYLKRQETPGISYFPVSHLALEEILKQPSTLTIDLTKIRLPHCNSNSKSHVYKNWVNIHVLDKKYTLCSDNQHQNYLSRTEIEQNKERLRLNEEEKKYVTRLLGNNGLKVLSKINDDVRFYFLSPQEIKEYYAKNGPFSVLSLFNFNPFLKFYADGTGNCSSRILLPGILDQTIAVPSGVTIDDLNQKEIKRKQREEYRSRNYPSSRPVIESGDKPKYEDIVQLFLPYVKEKDHSTLTTKLRQLCSQKSM